MKRVANFLRCWKKFLGLALIAALSVNVLPIGVIAAETSGSCGDGVFWRFDEASGTITISGNGATDDFEALIFDSDGTFEKTDPPPWESFTTNIKSVVIEEGVRYLGESAFKNCMSLQNLELPSSLLMIGNFAFLYCTQLEQVVIPENVSYIGCDVFVGNESAGLPCAYFLGDAPELKASGEGNRSFSNGATLYYLPQKSGWTSQIWNGYATDTWNGHDFPEPSDHFSQGEQWEEPWLEDEPNSEDIEVKVVGTQYYSYAYEVAEKVNGLRDSLGLQRLELDENLMKVAMQRAAECSAYYSHTRPNNTDCTDIFPPASAMGENIAAGQLTPGEVMDSWTNSPGHYQNMVKTCYTKIGVGCFKSGDQFYWTQAFSSGKSYEHTKQTDTEEAVPVIINKEHLSLRSKNPELSLKIGENALIPLYIENAGFYNVATMIQVSNVNFRYPSAVAISFDPITVTGRSTGRGEITVTLSDDISTTIPVSVNAQFNDVPQTSWYYDAVTWADNRNLIDRPSAGNFAPEGQMSRGTTAIMLYRLENRPKIGNQASFSDVNGNEFIAATNWANNVGLMNGYGNGTFGPNDPLTREQMATILFRYSNYKGNIPTGRADLSGYSDKGEISDYAIGALEWANSAGLIQGTSPTILSPRKDISRAEAATIFMRFCNEYSNLQ